MKLHKKALLGITLLFMAMAAPAFSADSWLSRVVNIKEVYGETEGDWYYAYDDDLECWGVARYYGKEENVTIPSSLGGHPIEYIGRMAFPLGNNGIRSITIPDSVKIIKEDGIRQCQNLTSITIPSSVTSIGDRAFRDCTALTSITIPNSVTVIGNGAFQSCTALTNITMPNSVTVIGDATFGSCTSLRSITIPEKVTKLGNSAFANCTSLSQITITKGVKVIGPYAFKSCTGLTHITIPGNVENIDIEAFAECSGLKSITISDGVSNISDGAFRDCTGLTDIIIPGSVKKVGNDAFSGCSNLTRFTFGEGVASMGSYIFRNCAKLTDVTIPGSMRVIGTAAFWNCTGLTKVTFGEGITTIAKDMFSQCRSLKSVSLPSTLKTIGNNAFWLCGNLTDVTIPQGVTSIGDYAFQGCKSITDITIPDSVEKIGTTAFAACDALTSITIPGSVEKLEFGTFMNCDNLTDVIILEGVTAIEDKVFASCENLTNIAIPDSVQSIGDKVFQGANNLTIYSNPDSYADDYAGKNNIQKEDIKLEKPSGLKLSSAAETSLTMTWNEGIDITGYEVYRSGSADGAYQKITDVSSRSVTDQNLNPDSVYYYKIRAYRIIGDKKYYSADSDPVQARTKVVVVNAVSQLKQSASTASSITLTWKKSDGAVSYEVYRCTDKNGAYQKVAVTTSTNVTDKNLSAGSTYYYKVRAIRKVKGGTYYSAYTAPVGMKTKLKTPAKVTLKTGKKQIRVSWSKVAGANRYEVYRSTKKNGTYKKVATTSSVKVTNKKLKAGATYYYKVRAYKEKAGITYYSDYTAPMKMVTKPSAPKITLKTGKKRIKVSWKKVNGAKGYAIYLSKNKSKGYKRVKTAKASATSYTRKGLKSGERYFIKVRSYVKTPAGKKIYSGYSKVRSVKVK